MHADKVIRVHDGVDETIQKDREVNVAVVVDVSVEPVKQVDGQMMVNVQKAELTPLLSQNNKDGIPKVPNLGDVKEPQKLGYGRILRIKRFAGGDGVSVAVGNHESFNGHVRTEHNLRHIVDKLERIGIHGGNSELHNGRANDHEDKVGNRNASRSREACQGPSLSTE